MNASGGIFVLSGPSGAGKSTLIRHLRESVSMLGYSVSHTSRKPRGAEVDGVDYHFVDRDTFTRMIEKGDFVEWAEVYNDLYGTSFSSLEIPISQGLDLIMDVDVQGAKNIKARFNDSVLVYILPPSLKELAKRLKSRRTESEEAVRERLEEASREIRNCLWYDYIIFNDDLMRAAEEMKSVVTAERCRRSRQLPKARKAFDLEAQ
jgi:guanylate kinase